MDDKPELKSSFTISYTSLLRVSLFVVLAWLAIILRDILLVLLTSVVLAAAIRPFARWFEKYKIPTVLAVLLVYVISFGVIFGTLYFLVPPLFADISDITSTLPKQISTFLSNNPAWATISSFSDSFSKALSIKDFTSSGFSVWPSLPGSFSEALKALFSGAINFVLIVVISFYLAVQKHGVEEFLRLIVPLRSESYVLGLWKRVERKIGFWLQGQLLLGLIIGPIVYLGLTLLGIKYALVLAILASIFELIPFFGPVLSAVPAVLLGFSVGIPLGIMVIGFYVVVQQFENHLIYPLVVKKIIGVPPLVVVISLVVGAKLAGFLGLILAVPLATLLMELVSDISERKGLFRQSQKDSPQS